MTGNVGRESCNKDMQQRSHAEEVDLVSPQSEAFSSPLRPHKAPPTEQANLYVDREATSRHSGTDDI